MITFRPPETILEWLLLPFIATWLFFNLYMIFCAFDRAWDAGKKPHWLAYALGGPSVFFGLLLDLAWNFTIGSLLFLQVPWYTGAGHPAKWTFTRRVRYWYRDETWRGKQARWWADKILNIFDPQHVQ
jgi:hypothetical protein